MYARTPQGEPDLAFRLGRFYMGCYFRALKQFTQLLDKSAELYWILLVPDKRAETIGFFALVVTHGSQQGSHSPQA